MAVAVRHRHPGQRVIAAVGHSHTPRHRIAAVDHLWGYRHCHLNRRVDDVHEGCIRGAHSPAQRVAALSGGGVGRVRHQDGGSDKAGALSGSQVKGWGNVAEMVIAQGDAVHRVVAEVGYGVRIDHRLADVDCWCAGDLFQGNDTTSVGPRHLDGVDKDARCVGHRVAQQVVSHSRSHVGRVRHQDGGSDKAGALSGSQVKGWGNVAEMVIAQGDAVHRVVAEVGYGVRIDHRLADVDCWCAGDLFQGNDTTSVGPRHLDGVDKDARCVGHRIAPRIQAGRRGNVCGIGLQRRRPGAGQDIARL